MNYVGDQDPLTQKVSANLCPQCLEVIFERLKKGAKLDTDKMEVR